MTTEYDPTPAGSGWGMHLPIIVLTFAFAIFLAAQISATRQSGKTMQWQLSVIDKQILDVKAAEKQADEINQKAEEPVKQANQLEERFTALLNDVFDLAKDDDDAKKVIQKYGIQRNANQKEGADKGEDKK